ncbi:MAG: outer membrane beta-barrel protein [Legionella sp.]|nr:outer membrane beta-barrel protein [Legionella sp.]
MYHRVIISGFIAGIMATQTYAGTMGEAAPADNGNWVVSFSLGPVWADAGETQTFFLTPDIEKTYVASHNNDVLTSGEVFVGYQNKISSVWYGQLGIALASTSGAELQGIIWDDADPQFDNYSYRYRVQNNRVAVKGKLLLDKGYWLMPWVSASLGVGFNRAYDYTNTPLIFEAETNPNFSNHTETAFTYTLGVGLQKCINDHWQVGAGYEFTDWGHSELGRAPGQTLNTGLRLNHLETNGLMFNLTYVC